MINLLTVFIKGLLEALKPLVVPFLYFYQGIITERAMRLEDLVKEKEKHEKIEEGNRVKSDADILDELRKRDTRKP